MMRRIALIELCFCASDQDFEGQQGHFNSSDRLQVQASKLSSDPDEISTGLVFSGSLQSAEAGRAVQARKIEDQALQSKCYGAKLRKMVMALSLARSGRIDEADRFADRSQPGSTVGHYSSREVSRPHSSRRD